jgi:hypothetical protein
MDLPDWVVDDVLPHRRHAAAMLVICLFRHGSPRVIEGERRVYLALPRGGHGTGPQTLAGRAHVSKRALDAAIDELMETGLLIDHQATRWGVAGGLSFPVDRPARSGFIGRSLAENWPERGATSAPLRGATSAPHFESERGATSAPHHGGGGRSSDLPWDHDRQIFRTTTNARARAEALAGELIDLGVNEPNRWLDRYGNEAVDLALARLELVAPFDPAWTLPGSPHRFQPKGVRNAPGLLKKWLDADERARELLIQPPSEQVVRRLRREWEPVSDAQWEPGDRLPPAPSWVPEPLDYEVYDGCYSGLEFWDGTDVPKDDWASVERLEREDWPEGLADEVPLRGTPRRIDRARPGPGDEYWVWAGRSDRPKTGALAGVRSDAGA